MLDISWDTEISKTHSGDTVSCKTGHNRSPLRLEYLRSQTSLAEEWAART